MAGPDDKDQALILGILNQRGSATSQEMQAATGKSQATISRALAALGGAVLAVGRARATRYALPKSIHGRAAQQPLWWTDARGEARQIGTLSHFAGGTVHVEVDDAQTETRGGLPWFLAPLRAHGFLGRLLAMRLKGFGIGRDPDRWGLDDVLFAALSLHDAPGAISLGEPRQPETSAGSAASEIVAANLGESLDRLAGDVALSLPAGSSAGGEQPKFLALIRQDARSPAQHVLVKFSPPRGQPFGERWHDLLHAEALASQTLADHGVEVARCAIVETARRTYLVSERFDRVGERGRRHVVAVGDVHAAFVADAYRQWGATCAALARQRRLPELDAARAAALLSFGRLIGNSDMHAGNLSLFVEREDLRRGRFSLAPVYDMLPMRWKPTPELDRMLDYLPFEVDAFTASGGALAPALDFWTRLAASRKVGRAMTALAEEMRRRVAAAAGG